MTVLSAHEINWRKVTLTDPQTVSNLPVWHGFLSPILEVLADGVARSRRLLRDDVFAHMKLSEAQRAERVPTGGGRAAERYGWALSGLVKAELVLRPERATYRITEAGREFLTRHRDGISDADLKEVEAYRAYVPRQQRSAKPTQFDTSDTAAPIEQIEAGVARLDQDVGADLLKRLREQPPEFLEAAVLDVLVAMGYGGTEQQATRLGRTGDEGIDGVIDQDPLGLERIYVQAKRYAEARSIGRPELQAFVGAPHGQGAARGIFITTSSFATTAFDYVKNIGARVILIDGARLASLMIRYGVGVHTRRVFKVVETDEDYFE